MAALLMNLRYVTDEEVAEVRALLDDSGIVYYETPPSMWGISAGGIWLSDGNDRERARALMSEYQSRRFEQQRALWREARERGEAPTLWRRIKAEPLRVLVLLVAAAAVLLVAVAPFLAFG